MHRFGVDVTFYIASFTIRIYMKCDEDVPALFTAYVAWYYAKSNALLRRALRRSQREEWNGGAQCLTAVAARCAAEGSEPNSGGSSRNLSVYTLRPAKYIAEIQYLHGSALKQRAV